MKAPRFDYVRPVSLCDALAALSEHGSDAKVLAGGQSLMPMLAFRMAAPRVLVDIGRLGELKEMKFDARGLSLGALVRWCDIERSARIGAEHPLLAEAIRHVAHYQIRSRGTVGGSLAHADPAAEMPAIALVSDATIVVAGAGGQREIAAGDFFVGALTTVLDARELLVGVRLPAWPAERRWAFEEFSRRKGDFALADGHEAGSPRSNPRSQREAPPAPEGEDPEDLNLKRATDALERRLILRALERAGGNRAEAARLLGIGRPNLYAKMRELGVAQG